MAIIYYPPNLRVSKLHWETNSQDIEFRGPFGVQTMNASPPLWKANVNFDLLTEAEAGAYQALILQLQGARNNLALWNLGRPIPRGTMRGAPTFSTAGLIGATSLALTNPTQAGTSLNAGDYLGIGVGYTSQVVMVTAPVLLDATGFGTVSFAPPLRSATNAGDAIVWYQPAVLFRQQTVSVGWDYESNTVGNATLDLLEDWRA